VKRIASCLTLALLVVACQNNAPRSLDQPSLPPASVGQQFDAPLTVGGVSLTPTVTKGSLPPGLALYDSSGGTGGTDGIKGTPTAAGTYTFTVELKGHCTMGGCVGGSHDYTLAVGP